MACFMMITTFQSHPGVAIPLIYHKCSTFANSQKNLRPEAEAEAKGKGEERP